jgi:type IV secretion system protein VirB10
MRQPQTLNNDDEEDTPIPVPPWKRPRVIMVAFGVIIVIALIVGNTPAKPPPEDAKEHAFTVGEVVPLATPPATSSSITTTPAPVQPSKLQLALGDPTPPFTTSPFAPPAAPDPVPTATAPDLRKMAAGAPTTPAVSRPTEMSYAVHMPAYKAPTVAPEDAKTALSFKAASILGSKASPAVDESLMLAPGLLPLVLETDIESDLPGPLLAHTYGPTLSKTGAVLMPDGTQIVGRYETMKQNAGNRLYAVSVVAHVPVSPSKGVWVPLVDAQFADDLGKTGLDGEVNNHFAQRFGAALVLAFTDSALQYLQSQNQSSGNTYLSFSSGGGGGGGGALGNLAQEILRSQINIAPTFTKHHGELVAIVLTQPISFNDTYKETAR